MNLEIENRRINRSWSILCIIGLFTFIGGFLSLSAFSIGEIEKKDEALIINSIEEIKTGNGEYVVDVLIEKRSQFTSKEGGAIGNLHIASLSSHIAESYSKELYVKDFGDLDEVKISIPIKSQNNGMGYRVYLHTGNEGEIGITDVSFKKELTREKTDSAIREVYIYEEGSFSLSNTEVVSDSEALNGQSIKISDKTPGYSIFGPYTTKEKKGNHRVHFRLKTSDNTSHKPLVQVQVYNSSGDGINKSLLIKGSDFTDKNKYQDFHLDYTRTMKGNLEFRVLYLGNENVYLDNVKNHGIYR